MMIRLCREEEIAAVGEFYDHVVRYLCEHVNYPKWVYKDYPSEDSVREMTEAGVQFVCMDEGRILGAFVLSIDPQGAYEKAAWSRQLAEGRYLVCHTLAAEPSVQRRGVGRRIVEYCVIYAKEHGFEAIRLDVVPENLPAKRLYEKCGFSYIGDVDLERGIPEIPLFSMYELNF